jgi:hypothetical protein
VVISDATSDYENISHKTITKAIKKEASATQVISFTPLG